MSSLAERTSTSGIVRRRGQRVFYAVGLFILFVLGIGLAWLQINQYEDGLVRRAFIVQEAGLPPVSTLEINLRDASENMPVLIVAHGFSANKETMQAIGIETARRLGMRVFLFDFPGHGFSPTRFPITKSAEESTNNLLPSLEAVYNYVRRSFPNAQIALASHSMGTGIVARFAIQKPDIMATILVSPASLPDLTPDSIKNLLILVGENDISQSLEGAQEAYEQSTATTPSPDFPADARSAKGAEVGDLKDGSARRVRVLAGQNHITILYTADTMAEINSWLGRGLLNTDGQAVRAAILNDENGAGFRLRWTIVGIIFSVCTFFALASLLIDALNLRVILSAVPRHPSLRKSLQSAGILLLAEVGAALLWTPLKLPPQLVGLQLGSYLAGFFLVVGLLFGLWLWRDLGNQQFGPRPADYSRSWSSVLSAKIVGWGLVPLVLFAGVYLTLGLFSAFTWESLQFSLSRILPFLILAVCLFPYFLTNEYIFRRMSIWGGYWLSLVSKLGVLIVLFGAVLLSPADLGFLTILLPVLALLFTVFGLFSIWLYWLGRDFITTAVLQTLLFAWIISCFFPLI